MNTCLALNTKHDFFYFADLKLRILREIDNEEIDSLTTIALNNLAVDLYEHGELFSANGIYMEVLMATKAALVSGQHSHKCISPVEKRKENVSKITCSEEKLRQVKCSSKTKQPCELDIYQESDSVCNRGPKFLLEAIKIDSYPKNDTKFMRYISAIALYNTALIHIRLASFDVTQELFDIVRELFPEDLQDIPLCLAIMIPALYNNLGCIQYKYGNFEKAEENFMTAVKLGREAITNQHKVSIAAMSIDSKKAHWYCVGTALSNMGRISYEKGRHDVALSRCQNALDARRVALGNDHIEVIMTTYNLGLIYHRKGVLDEAMGCYQKCFDQFESRCEEEDAFSRHVVTILTEILSILCKKVAFDNASFCLDQALKKLKIARCEFGNNHIKVSTSLNQVASILIEQAEYNYALNFFIEKLRIEKITLGHNHHELAVTLYHIGHTCQQLSFFDDALDMYEEALTLIDCMDGSNKLSGRSLTADIYYNMGMILLDTSPKKALRVLDHSLRLRKQTIGENHPHIPSLLYFIGLAQLKMSRVAEARESFFESLRIIRCVLGNDHQQAADSLYQLGKIYEEEEEYKEALHFYHEALCMKRKALEMNHPMMAEILHKVGEIHQLRGDLDLAIDVYNEALLMTRDVMGDHHGSVLFILSSLGNAYTQSGRASEARRVFLEALRISEESLFPFCELDGDNIVLLSPPTAAAA